MSKKTELSEQPLKICWIMVMDTRNFCVFFRLQHSCTYVDAAFCHRRSSMACLFVSLSVTIVSPAKTAEPIEMLFGVCTWVGSRKHLLDGGGDPPCQWAILRGKGAAHCKI